MKFIAVVKTPAIKVKVTLNAEPNAVITAVTTGPNSSIILSITGLQEFQSFKTSLIISPTKFTKLSHNGFKASVQIVDIVSFITVKIGAIILVQKFCKVSTKPLIASVTLFLNSSFVSHNCLIANTTNAITAITAKIGAITLLIVVDTPANIGAIWVVYKRIILLIDLANVPNTINNGPIAAIKPAIATIITLICGLSFESQVKKLDT